MTPLHPITIVGGGLAGLSLGIALRKSGVPTNIVEAADYPRHRVCGEFITGLDQATLDELEIGPAFSGAASHRRMTWFFGERAVSHSTLPVPAIAVSRYTLDARLAKMFTAAGGELLTRTRYISAVAEPGWVQTNGRKCHGNSPWIGLKLHARGLSVTDELELHLGADAYVGLSSVEDGWVNVCGLFRRKPGLRFAPADALSAYLRASKLPRLADRLAAAQIRPGSRCAVAGIAFDRHLPAADGVQLGDACAMIPPFTGNGMAMAFVAAALAKNPLLRWARGDCSWEETVRGIRETLAHEFNLRLAGAGIVHPFFLTRAWQHCLEITARAGLLPLRPMYHLLH